MSRSYKKIAIAKIKSKYEQKLANRKVRYSDIDYSDGANYKKQYDGYVTDWKSLKVDNKCKRK